MNLCQCGLDFGSVAAFDAHRVGVHAYDFKDGLKMDPPREDGRRCLDEAEIAANPRFERNAYGRWSLRAEAERGRRMNPRSGNRPS